MIRSTIDYGIDLGTTNSAIAVLNGTEVQVIRNEEQMEYTPSAIWIDERGRMKVGRAARERMSNDNENVATEFKLHMGTQHRIKLPHCPRELSPEELSAEVLKELRKDAVKDMSEEVDAAVITVPAAFETPQRNATLLAAKAAGFATAQLLPEPVAAALAYGFQSEEEHVFWLVFDLGGGTFDAAIIQLSEGEIKVVNHGGDNHLGGKDLDWEIVDQLLLPAAREQSRCPNVVRGNVEWKTAVALLKKEGEAAKIRLSRSTETEIELDALSDRERKHVFDFRLNLRRSDVECLFEPIVNRTIRIVRKVLDERHLSPQHIGKLLLVGGPTMTPYLRERLKDRERGLGIPLEFRIDPLTAVARGAAIFAGTQRVERRESQPAVVGSYRLILDHKPMGADTEPGVGGQLVGPPGARLDGFTVEFVNRDARPPWRGGKVPILPNGHFVTSLWAEKGRTNLFDIELRDAQGNRQQVEPATTSYTVGVVFTSPLLIRSIGVALADNKVARFFDKGTPLPAHRSMTMYAAVEVCPGQSGQLLGIPVVEGENARADRNPVIGSLNISGANVQRTVQAGSEIEVDIKVDESGQVEVTAYVPVLDAEFSQVLSFKAYHEKARQPGEMKRQLDEEKRRLAVAREKARRVEDPEVREHLERIARERLVDEADKAAAAAAVEGNEADRCEQRVLELRVAVDEVEDAMMWPEMIREAREAVERTNTILGDRDFGATAAEKDKARGIAESIEEAITARDADQLKRWAGEAVRLGGEVLRRQPAFWLAHLGQLESRVGSMRDQAQARAYLEQGKRAVQMGDTGGVERAVRALVDLLPDAQQETNKINAGLRM